jgi:hypothetical protein
LHGIVAAGVGKKTVGGWWLQVSIFETPFRTKKHELASILRLGLQIWTPNSFLPKVSGWQFPRSRLRLKTGLGTMAIWNLWLLQTRCLGNQQPEELDPVDPLDFLVALDVCPCWSQTRPSFCLKRLI